MMCWTYACFSFAHRITPILWGNAKRKADDVRSTYKNFNCHGCFTAEEANATWENELRKERKLSEANDNCILFSSLTLPQRKASSNEWGEKATTEHECALTHVFVYHVFKCGWSDLEPQRRTGRFLHTWRARRRSVCSVNYLSSNRLSLAWWKSNWSSKERHSHTTCSHKRHAFWCSFEILCAPRGKTFLESLTGKILQTSDAYVACCAIRIHSNWSKKGE